MDKFKPSGSVHNTKYKVFHPVRNEAGEVAVLGNVYKWITNNLSEK